MRDAIVLRELDLHSATNGRSREQLGAFDVSDRPLGENGALKLGCARHASERVKVPDDRVAKLRDAWRLSPAVACRRDELADSRSGDPERGCDLRLARPGSGGRKLR